MVGAAVGFGGKLIRTVSFFGCTFAASAGLGGREPAGRLGVSSAIIFFIGLQTKSRVANSQMVIRATRGLQAVE